MAALINDFIGSVINPAVDFHEQARGKIKYTDTFRRFFGETENNAEPMITGFGIIYFTKLPEPLDDATNANYLTAMTTQLDIPDMTVDSIDYEGRDGGQWHVPGAVKMSSDLTLNLWEMRGAVTYSMISRWIHIMRNPIFGFMTESTWKQQNYKGRLMYVVCTPDLEVQVAKVYSGIWPTDLRDSAFKMDQNQDKIEYSVTFKFDHYPYTSVDINAQAQQMVRNTVSNLNTIISGKYEIAKGSVSDSFGTGVTG